MQYLYPAFYSAVVVDATSLIGRPKDFVLRCHLGKVINSRFNSTDLKLKNEQGGRHGSIIYVFPFLFVLRRSREWSKYPGPFQNIRSLKL